MSIQTLAFNTRDGFNDPTRQQDLIDFVEHIKPDVAFFSEAYSARFDADFAQTALRSLGYEVQAGEYDDIDGRKDRHGYIGITRIPNAIIKEQRFETRNGVHILARDPITHNSFDLFGLHADDRKKQGRITQLGSIPALVRQTIIVGDLNAMDHMDPLARVARFVKPLADRLYSIEPAETVSLDWRNKAISKMATRAVNIAGVFGSHLQRLSDMASGEEIRMLQDQGFRDADTLHAPTMHHVAQLDHMMITDGVYPLDFNVLNDVKLSDHKPISSRLVVR